jgi:hypothetical protein
MILAGKQNCAQGGVTPSAPPAHPLTAMLGDLLEVTHSMAESVSVLVLLRDVSGQQLRCYFGMTAISAYAASDNLLWVIVWGTVGTFSLTIFAD